MELSNPQRLTHMIKQTTKTKRIVFSGLIRKMKFFFLYNTRQLILYNNKTLEYVDPQTNVLKGTIELTKDTVVDCESEARFYVQTPKRKYVFESLEYPARTWVTNINASRETVKEFHF